MATFTGLADDKAETMTLGFSSSGGLTVADSTSITVIPAVAAKLVVQTQPSAATAGEAFATQPVVAEEDAYGNIETGDSSTTVTVSPASGDGPLQGTATATLVRGVATFPGLIENTAGPLTLNFTAGSLTRGISDAIIVAAAPATQLVVTTPPTTLVAGQPFTVAVAAEDTYGNVDTSYSGDVTISLPSGSGAPVTAQAQSGVATFTGLTVSTTAQGGSIQATRAA